MFGGRLANGMGVAASAHAWSRGRGQAHTIKKQSHETFLETLHSQLAVDGSALVRVHADRLRATHTLMPVLLWWPPRVQQTQHGNVSFTGRKRDVGSQTKRQRQMGKGGTKGQARAGERERQKEGKRLRLTAET